MEKAHDALKAFLMEDSPGWGFIHTWGFDGDKA